MKLLVPHHVKVFHTFTWKHRAGIMVVVVAVCYVVGEMFHMGELTKGLDGLIAVSVDKFIFGHGNSQG